MVMHRLATGATAALVVLFSAAADAAVEASPGGEGDRTFVMDNGGKFIEDAVAAPKKAKWKKKHLLLMVWGGVFLVLWSLAGFFLYRCPAHPQDRMGRSALDRLALRLIDPERPHAESKLLNLHLKPFLYYLTPEPTP